LSSQDGHAYAVDAGTGDVIWRSPKLGVTLQAAPAAVLSAYGGAKDLVFVATRNSGQPNRLYALDASDGAVVWSFDNGGAATGIGIVVSGPSVDYTAGRVYFTSATGASGRNAWCLDFAAASPPQPCWAGFGVATGADSEASPILFAGSVLVSESAASGNLYGLDTATGAASLLAALGGGGAKGYVFPRFGTTDVLASTATTVWSIDTAVPTTNWSGGCVSTPSTPTAVPFTDFVFLGSTEGKLFQMSAASGSGCPSTPSVCIGDCTSTVVGAPAYDLLHGMLYAGTDEGKVYGVRVPFP
jgi:outer membrane protein assembly factor BamB